MKTLLERVEEESQIYEGAIEHAVDHLKMANAVLFEEFEGRDINGILTKLKKITEEVDLIYKDHGEENESFE